MAIPDTEPDQWVMTAADGRAAPLDLAASAVVRLAQRPLAVAAGDNFTLDLTVTWWAPEPARALEIVLALPASVTARDGAAGELRQLLPPLGYGETHVATFALRSPADTANRVVTLRGGLDCAGCRAAWAERRLGIHNTDADRDRPTDGADTRRAAVTVDAEGGMLASPDGALLLVPPGAVDGSTTFRYEGLYHWGDAVQPRPPDGAHRVWLPLAAASHMDAPTRTPGPQVLERSVAEDVPSADPALDLALEDNGVWLFNLWQLEAQAGIMPLEVFTTPLELQVDLSGWSEAGISPDILNLWTRETADEPWALVPSRIEDDVLSAELLHFSQFGLGTSLATSGDQPPNVQMFTVDQLNGTANVGYPIDTPAGLGGMRPHLAFTYASSSQDDLTQAAGDWQIVTQASPIGAGWRLDGISQIVRIGSENKFSLVIDGQSATIVKQDGSWRTTPSLFARLEWAGDGTSSGWGQWVVTMPDGVRYEFGDGGAMPTSFVATGATALALAETAGGTTYRHARQWRLRRVIDPLGNSMEVSYQGEPGSESGCIDDTWVTNNRNWYTRALDPTEILWSRNDAAGVGEYKMRVQFVYERAVKRQDLRIKGQADGDCIQAMFGEYNQLKEVRVDVRVSGAWRTLRSYTLTQDYKRFTKAGAEDMIRLYLTGITQRGARNGELPAYAFTYDMLNPNRMLLRTANNGQGGAITYTYGTKGSSCTSGVCPYGAVRYPVTRSTLADGMGGTVRTDYVYGPGMIADDGSFRSYRDVTITRYDVDRGGGAGVLKWEKLETYGGEAAGDRANPDPRRGRVRLQTVRDDATGPVLAVDEYDWQVQWWKDGAWRPVLPTYTWGAAAGSAQWIRQEAVTRTVGTAVNVTRSAYDPARQNGEQYGNVTDVQEYGDGVLLRNTVTEYFPNPATHVVSLPARVTVYDPQGACVAETRTVYGAYYAGGVYVTQVDGGYNQPPLNTLPVKTERRLRGGCTTAAVVAKYDANWAITRYAYDAVGNQTTVNQLGESSSGSQDLAIQTVFDSVYRLFPVEQYYSKLPLHKEMVTYYGVNGLELDDSKAFWGAIQEHCAVNDLCTRQAYDEFGRPQQRWMLAARGSAWSGAADVAWSYINRSEPAQQRFVVTEWHAPFTAGECVRRHYNGLGQLVQTQQSDDGWTAAANEDPCGGTLAPRPEIDVDTLYDGLGRSSRISVPHATTQPWGNRPADWSQGYVTTTYDALGRTVRTVAPNGGVTETKYSGRKMVVAGRGRSGDTDRVLQWSETDGAGNLLRVQTWTKPYEQGGVVDGEVLLTHDTLGNLTRVALPSGAVATLSYDMGGRKIAMDDPDLGDWTYAYDRQDKLVRQTDARRQTICLYYDAAGRLTGKDLNQGSASGCAAAPAYELTYTYDGGHSASNRSRGQVTQVRYADGSYTRSLTYNSKGLLATETASIAGAPQSYTMSYGYDDDARLISTTYPNGELVTIAGYTARGLPTGLASSRVTAALVDNVAYDAAGRPTRQRYPAGAHVQHSWRYAPDSQQDNDGGALAGILLERTDVQPSQRLISFDYRYDSFGNLSAQSGNGAGWLTFTYDAQNRLTAAYDKNYAYDAAGRMTSYEGASRSYAGAGPVHAPKGAGYTYDANGNLTARSGLALTWNAENRLAGATVSGATVESYTYDDTGMRVKKVSNGVATYYPFPHYEVQVSGATTTVTRYYFFGGQRIAMQRGSEPLTYLHSDYLNSTLMATQGVNVTGQERYYAYGKDRYTGPTVPTDNRFTGQKEDATGLVYMNARYYDPVLGQFVSPDTLVPDAKNLLDYNRYLYARGNPLKYTDPSGHCPICVVLVLAGAALLAEGSVASTPVDQYAGDDTNANGMLAATLLVGDANDFVTIVTGNDYVWNEAVPYGSTEWWQTVGLSLMPVASGSSLRVIKHYVDAGQAVDDIARVSAKFFDGYTPGPKTAFAGVYDPKSGSYLLRPSGDTVLKSGNRPIGSVPRNLGHQAVNQELYWTHAIDPKSTVGFTLFYDAPGQLSISWKSASVNLANHNDIVAPSMYQSLIVDAIEQTTGMSVRPR